MCYNSSMLTKEFLRQRQSLPLEAKIVYSQERIREFYDQNEGNVYVAFSGGKDSTVLLHLVRDLYPNIPAVFNNTGQEFPEIRQFIATVPNVVKLKPLVKFTEVVEEYGWPILSKKTAKSLHYMQKLSPVDPQYANYERGVAERWRYLRDAPFKISDYCCDALKKRPAKMYEKATGRKPYLGMMASDSDQRELTYFKRGFCNTYGRLGTSWPLATWTERDVWEYLKTKGVPYSKIYDIGYSRTGCMFCLFGIHLDCGFMGENRIQTMSRTHPRLWNYYVTKTRLPEVMDLLNLPYKSF